MCESSDGPSRTTNNPRGYSYYKDGQYSDMFNTVIAPRKMESSMSMTTAKKKKKFKRFNVNDYIKRSP